MKLDFKSSLLIEQYWLGFSKGAMGLRGEEDWEIMTTYVVPWGRRN